MDWGTVMGVITAILLVAYLGVLAWVYNRARKPQFDEAARLPLLYDEGDG
jgi:cytochrome c oxidase cbb3-type subunit 4